MKKSIGSKTNFIPPVGFLVVAGIIFWQTNTDLTSKDVASGSAQYNAAMVPELIATIIACLAIAQLRQVFRADVIDQSLNEEFQQFRSPMIWRCIIVLGLTAGLVFAQPYLGYFIVMPVYLMALYLTMEVRNLLIVIIMGLAVSMSAAFIFGNLLKVVLPAGIFEFVPF